METMAVLARTAPPLAGTGRRPSAAVRPSAFLSFAAASTGTCGRVEGGLSTTTVGSGSAARARAVPRGIVASSVGSPACLVGFNLHLLGGCGNGKMFFPVAFAVRGSWPVVGVV